MVNLKLCNEMVLILNPATKV